MHSPIPVNIITGALGAGKTTAIARLLASKPVAESWLVILNEFTDTGIDTLTLAAAARGAYDVRLIPGGCLCCTGEEDFRRQLSGLLARPSEQWPARILIEPSGIGHPGAIVEELRLFARNGALRLDSTIVLLDGQCHVDGSTLDAVTRAQVDAADVLLLSKADLVDAVACQSFLQWAHGLFPAKRFVACCAQGMLPELALRPPPAVFEFELPARPLLHQRALPRRSAMREHDHAPQFAERRLQWRHAIVQAKTQHLLAREACGWLLPPTILFDLSRLRMLLSDDAWWQGVDRCKAILRTGVACWHLLHRWGRQHSIAECNWFQDGRIEVQMAEGVQVDWSVWDRRWQSLSEHCPVG